MKSKQYLALSAAEPERKTERRRVREKAKKKRPKNQQEFMSGIRPQQTTQLFSSALSLTLFHCTECLEREREREREWQCEGAADFVPIQSRQSSLVKAKLFFYFIVSVFIYESIQIR